MCIPPYDELFLLSLTGICCKQISVVHSSENLVSLDYLQTKAGYK